MDPDALIKLAQEWIDTDPDPVTRAEMRELVGRPGPNAELADRFRGRLEFGTAGLRGVLAAGPTRMNRAVVARATWAVAEELRANVPRTIEAIEAIERVVVVGGDARWMSRELCEDVAAILAGAGLRVILFQTPVPTPLVAFAVGHLHAAAGVVITASHNPAEYSGYKLYWQNGAQVTLPIDAHIEAAIDRAPPANQILRPSLDDLFAAERVRSAPADIERSYLDAVQALRRGSDAGPRDLPIVYTALHGVGATLAVRALREAGFHAIASVPEQERPDPAFPTVRFPNPEEPGAMDLAVALASGTGAAVVLANDPDADRLAVAVAHQGHVGLLSGNELGVLLGHYLLTTTASSASVAGATRAGVSPRPRAVVSSIVSSPMLGRIARDLGAHYEETLTGFKWIANRAIALEGEGYDFIFGYEEALGYCIGNAVRDKDGISAAVVVAEMVASLRDRGRTLVDQLGTLASRWGSFASGQLNVTRAGPGGTAAIAEMMATLRRSPPSRLGGEDVIAISDYRLGVRTVRGERTAVRLALPQSDVLAFELASGNRVIARPSGTEPKAKFYVDVLEAVQSGESIEQGRDRARVRAARLKEACAALAESLAPARQESPPAATSP